MTRFAALALLSSLVAVPAAAQVINGETPLDETRVNGETSRPGDADRSPPPGTAVSPMPPQDTTPAPSAPCG